MVNTYFNEASLLFLLLAPGSRSCPKVDRFRLYFMFNNGLGYNLCMFDTLDADILEKIKNWASDNSNIKTVILTGSKANGAAKADKLSDFDIELFVDNIDAFNDDTWLLMFGKILSKWPLNPGFSGFRANSITRLVVFEDYSRIDFQIMPIAEFNNAVYDEGLLVLIDKIGLASSIPKPTRTNHLITKPSEQQFVDAASGFYWDVPYIAKALRRGEISFARYMLLGAIRYESFGRMLAWYLSSQRNWCIEYGVHGRNFEKYADKELASKINNLCADENPDNIWETTKQMIELFDMFTLHLAKELEYPTGKINTAGIIKYCKAILNTSLD